MLDYKIDATLGSPTANVSGTLDAITYAVFLSAGANIHTDLGKVSGLTFFTHYGLPFRGTVAVVPHGEALLYWKRACDRRTVVTTENSHTYCINEPMADVNILAADGSRGRAILKNAYAKLQKKEIVALVTSTLAVREVGLSPANFKMKDDVYKVGTEVLYNERRALVLDVETCGVLGTITLYHIGYADIYGNYLTGIVTADHVEKL